MNILAHLTPSNHAACLVFPDHQLSYAALAEEIGAAARRISGPRALVAIAAEPKAHFVITYLAALQAGHAVALLPPGDEGALTTFVRDFAPALSFPEQHGSWSRTLHAEGPGALHPDLAVMLATSGTEGRPRWVRLSRGNIAANAESIARFLGLGPGDRAAYTLPFHYSYGLSVLHSHLAAGASLAFCGTSVVDEGFIAGAARLRCTSLAGVPYSYELLERIGFRDRLWPELRCMTVAGGRLEPQLALRYEEAMRRHGGAFYVMYGQTEATARMAYVPPALLREHADTIGIAIPGGRLRLADAEGLTLDAPGATGELYYSGPNVMMGYATTAADLARGAELAELATGDIATRDEAGLFRLQGRARRFSKIAGLRIGHEAVEWALKAEGFDCVVTGTDGALTLHMAAGNAEQAALAASRTAGLPARHVRCLRHEALPRLPSGKIDLAALQEAAAAAPLPDPASAGPGGLPAAFRAIFYPRAVTASDSFESLEGDSLSYVQASLAVERRLGHMPQGWEAMPVSALEELAGKRPAARRGWFGTVESHIVLRAAAILLIVVHHATLLPIPGGAAALMLLVGYGFARFHREALFAGRTGALLLPMLRNLLPYFVIVAGFALAWERIPWASVLLIGNLGFADPAAKTMLPFQFWFVEAYVQLCLLTAAAFSWPALRRAAGRRPFELALGLAVFAFGLRYAVPLVYDIGGRKIFMLSYVLWYAALGWCACFADSTRKTLLLLAVAGILCPFAAYTGGNWMGGWILYMMQFGVLAVLLGLSVIPLPRAAIPAVMLISAASYHIYLFHRIVPEMLGLDAMGPFGATASIVAGLASGIGAAALQRVIFRRLSRETGLPAREA